MPDLSILCVTRAEREIMTLLWELVENTRSLGAECVLVADGKEAHNTLSVDLAGSFKLAAVLSKGYIESVLDEAVSMTSCNYVLRIDDDERLSRQMVEWLRGKHYRSWVSWKFPRAHMCIDTGHYITNPPLWRDHQTRLSIRSLADGRHTIHCGSPYGGGKLAPVCIEHHKFLVKSLAQRQEVVDRYERLQPGAGSNFAVFSVPELVLDNIDIAPLDRAIAEALNDCTHATDSADVIPHAGMLAGIC